MNKTTDDGVTPLMAAAWQGNYKGAVPLLRTGAFINKIDIKGYTMQYKNAILVTKIY